MQRQSPGPQFKQVKKLGDFGSVQVSYSGSIGCSWFETHRKTGDCFKPMRDSFTVSWYPAESTLCREVEERDWQTCTPQQYVPLRLWDASRSVSDQSPNIYHPLLFSEGECRKPCRCVMPGGEGNTRCGCPPSLSAQQSLIPRIICSLFSFTVFFFFLKLWMFSKGIK